MKSRASYLILTLAVIVLGLLSRKIPLVPFFMGDVLYSVMVYFGLRCLFISTSKTAIMLASLTFCYFIEALQLCHAQWLIGLRSTLPGRYVLGQGFLWSDIAAYTFGIVSSYCIEKSFFFKSAS